MTGPGLARRVSTGRRTAASSYATRWGRPATVRHARAFTIAQSTRAGRAR